MTMVRKLQLELSRTPSRWGQAVFLTHTLVLGSKTVARLKHWTNTLVLGLSLALAFTLSPTCEPRIPIIGS